MQLRIKILKVIFAFSSLALLGKLFFWQVIKSAELSSQGRAQHNLGAAISAQRGSILASDGSFLAATARGWLVWASKPDLNRDNKTVANLLAPLLVDEEDQTAQEVGRIETLLAKKGVVWLPIKHQVDDEIKKKVEALNLAGVGFDPEDLRVYPESSNAAQVLGFVGRDAEGSPKGYFGLEGFYDLTLQGKPGFIEREADARGIPIAAGGSREVSAVGGVDLLTHLDKTIQLVVEEKLKAGVEKYGAKSGWVIVMDPQSGGILAVAAFPSYDPQHYSEFGDEYFKNPIISDSFEPGSIFKPLVMASALDAGVVEPETKCDLCGGPVKVDKYEIETWDKKYRPDSTMTDVIVHSDNVGMTFVGQRLGAERLFDYLTAFGIGSLTNIDLQGEANPGLRPKETWNIVDLATASFGQGVALTPIQMVRAMAAIANDGELVEPQVVDQIITRSGSLDVKPKTIRRVISKKAADEVTQMMENAVSQGEAKWTALTGFQVAGKTGTAQIPVSGHYDEEKTIGSFIGFAPADKPRFVMLVSLREAQSSPWASETAAPLWFAIANDLFPYLGISPKN